VCNIPSFGTRHLLSLIRYVCEGANISIQRMRELFHPNHPSSSISSHSTLASSLAHGRHILLSIIIKLPMSTTMGNINGKSTARGRASALLGTAGICAPQIISCVSLPIFSHSAAHRDPISIVRYYMRRRAPARIYSGAEQEKSQLKRGRTSCDSQAPNQ
jgi:hypothetical protein